MQDQFRSAGVRYVRTLASESAERIVRRVASDAPVHA
jgi:hypothetical protein